MLKEQTYYIQLVTLIRQDNYRMDILKTIRKIKTNELWIGGGFVRSLVWDYLHNYTHRTELGDIDVFYFDNKSFKNQERIIRKKLSKYLPNVNWSVKNQARMHLHDNSRKYNDLEDALTFLTETASSIAVRLDNKNDLQFIIPFSLEDVFKLVVRPTENCKMNTITYKKYCERIATKNWKTTWPSLIFEK